MLQGAQPVWQLPARTGLAGFISLASLTGLLGDLCWICLFCLVFGDKRCSMRQHWLKLCGNTQAVNENGAGLWGEGGGTLT